jgi:putative ABC transport system permease protein
VRTVLFAQLRAHAARLVASTLAVVIAVGFVVATLVLNETARSTVLEAVGARYVDAAVVVSSTDGTSLADEVDALAALGSVGAVVPTWETYVHATVPGRPGSQYVFVETVAEDPSLRWQRVSAGELPDSPGEVLVSERLRAAVGDVLTVTSFDATGTEQRSQATVTGIVDLGGDPTAGMHGRAFVTPQQAQDWGAIDPWQLRVAAAPGLSPDQVRTDVAATLHGREVEVRTGTEQAEQAAAAMMGGATGLTAVLLVFGTVAVLVAGLVIANTFAVLLAQRTRELALLRCVGATARQVRRSVLGEALATGLISSVIGVGVGIGLAAGVSAAVGGTESPIPLAGVSVPWYAVLIGLVVGTAVTVLAARTPARAATRVAPLAALRPADQAPLLSKGGVRRLVLGLTLLLPGVALLILGALLVNLLMALPGGVLSFLGLLLLAQRAVPPVVAAAGRLAGRFGGVPARLAAGNAARNPRRTAATATALLIGVTLTSAMVVGAASTRATVTAGLADEFPTDVMVHGWDGDLPASLLGNLEDIEGVVRGTAVLAADVTGPDGQPTYVHGVDAAQAVPTLRSLEKMPLPEAGQALVPEWLAEQWSVHDGDALALTHDGRALDLTVRVIDGGRPLTLTATELRTLSPEPAIGELWLRLAEAHPDGQVDSVDRITDVTASMAPSARVDGVVAQRNQIDGVLDMLLLVVTGLLGVAVVIALIGVGNTLALSVVERRQENGLLRALGLTRGQLRGLLAWEALLVAGVAAVLGVVLGGAYGLIGAASVLGEIGDIVLAVPWLQVAAIIAVATVAGLLASVLPARRAARTSPVAAIAG